MIRILLYDANELLHTPLRAAVDNALTTLGSKNHGLLRVASLEEMEETVMRAKSGFFDIIICRIDPAAEETLAMLGNIRQQDQSTCIIVIADDPKYAIESYKVGACGFCLAKEGTDCLINALGPVVERAKDRHSATIGLRSEIGTCSVVLDHIMFAEASRKGALLHFASGKTLLVRSTLQALAEKLVGTGLFVEAGSSFIINLDNVRSVGAGGAVIFESGESIIVPVRVRKAMKDVFEAFWRRPTASRA